MKKLILMTVVSLAIFSGRSNSFASDLSSGALLVISSPMNAISSSTADKNGLSPEEEKVILAAEDDAVAYLSSPDPRPKTPALVKALVTMKKHFGTYHERNEDLLEVTLTRTEFELVEMIVEIANDLAEPTMVKQQ